MNNNGTPVIVFTNHAKAAIALFISMCQPHLQSSVLSKRGVVVFAAGPKKSSIRASTCIQSFRWIACPACPMSRQKASTKPQRKTWESRSAQEEVCSREPNARIKWNLNDVRVQRKVKSMPLAVQLQHGMAKLDLVSVCFGCVWQHVLELPRG